MLRIFLSSSPEHWKFSHKLVAQLELSGFNIWNGFHDELQQLEQYSDLVTNQIREADVVIGLLPDSSDYHVENEVLAAMKSKRKIAIVVRPLSRKRSSESIGWADEVFDLSRIAQLSSDEEFDRLVEYLREIQTPGDLLRFHLEHRKADALQFITSVGELASTLLQEWQSNRPNDPEALDNWLANEDHMSELIEVLASLREKLLDLGDAPSQRDVGWFKEATAELGAHLRNWPLDNAKEISDSLWRTGFIGICASIGFAFGQPLLGAGVGTAMFASEKLGKGIASAVRGSANSG